MVKYGAEMDGFALPLEAFRFFLLSFIQVFARGVLLIDYPPKRLDLFIVYFVIYTAGLTSLIAQTDMLPIYIAT